MLFSAVALAAASLSGASAITFSTWDSKTCNGTQLGTHDFTQGLCVNGPTDDMCFLGGFAPGDPKCTSAIALFGIKSLRAVQGPGVVGVLVFNCADCGPSCVIKLPTNPNNTPLPCGTCVPNLGDINNKPPHFIFPKCDATTLGGGGNGTSSSSLSSSASSTAAPTASATPAKGAASNLAAPASAAMLAIGAAMFAL